MGENGRIIVKAPLEITMFSAPESAEIAGFFAFAYSAVKKRDIYPIQPEYTGEFGSFSHNGRVYSAHEQQEQVRDLLSRWDTDFISAPRSKIRLKAYSSLLANAFEQC